jgi:hypothetical protein
VRLTIGPSGKGPLTAEMEIRVLGIADRPTAVMLLEGDYRLVLLFLGHDTSFLHAHGARQLLAPSWEFLIIWGRSVCIAIWHAAYSRTRSGTERECRNENMPQNSSRLLLTGYEKWVDLRARWCPGIWSGGTFEGRREGVDGAWGRGVVGLLLSLQPSIS